LGGGLLAEDDKTLGISDREKQDVIQDAKLLEFIAEKYESEVLEVFRKESESIRLRALINQYNYAMINLDCNDVAYPVLRDLGFTFIRVAAEEPLRLNRLSTKNDVPAFLKSRTDCWDQIRENFVLSNNGTLEELKSAVYNTLTLIK